MESHHLAVIMGSISAVRSWHRVANVLAQPNCLHKENSEMPLAANTSMTSSLQAAVAYTGVGADAWIFFRSSQGFHSIAGNLKHRLLP